MWTIYPVEVELTEPLLGVVPKNPDVYKTWIESKQVKGDEGEPEYTEERSWTGFHVDKDKGLYIMDYHIKGYFKEVAAIMPETLGLKKKSGDLMSEQMIKHRLDNWLFIEPRRIYLGKQEPDGYIERPLRAETLRGKRIALARSDYVEGVTLQFTVVILNSSPIKFEQIRTWLAYGEKKGLGQFRTGGYGTFTYSFHRTG